MEDKEIIRKICWPNDKPSKKMVKKKHYDDDSSSSTPSTTERSEAQIYNDYYDHAVTSQYDY